MSTRGQFNTKNPTIKRILKEASELANNPSPDYHAEPLENDLFEWHFTLRGPPAPSPYANGIYHGRIQLPAAYPLRPPAFRFLTPTGRFEVNREICLSISGHHEESWQPAWGLRTALVAIRSFMDTNASGQLGGMDSSESARKKMAADSSAWKCAGCGMTNGEIMKEREDAVRQLQDSGKLKEEEVPEELKLAYREDLQQQPAAQSSAAPQPEPTSAGTSAETPRSAPSTQETSASSSRGVTARSIPIESAPNPAQSTPVPVNTRPTLTPTRTVAPRAQPQPVQGSQTSDDWLDKAIWGVIFALVLMVVRKYL
ncbi:UBC-like protein [Viridothelium virens]|uniref:UBC-like protein n=1 Tax=Viridothelium virens TaxID=1048519 RepID=A0A6A6HME7_VIRVR|nr:UBC-like protein [Viridothelium virens]